MPVLAKAEQEAMSNATTDPPFRFDLVSDKRPPSVDRPQTQQVLEQVSPSKADTLFVLAWTAAIVAVIGFIIFAALANPA
jgi:hypothetical protein